MTDHIDLILSRIKAFKHFRAMNPDKSYTSPEAEDAIALADALEAQAREIADCKRLREDERLTWDAQHKRQASVNAHLAALVTDAQEELRKCQQDAIALQARLAEIIGYCAQEGHDGEPYDTINAIALGQYSTRGGGK